MTSLSAFRQQQVSRVQRSLSLIALVAVVVTCDKAAPTGNAPDLRTAPPAAALAPGAPLAQAADSGISVQGTIPLPINQTFSNAAVDFGITQSGTGPAGFFKINNPNNSRVALLGQTNGTGAAVRGLSTGGNPGGPAGLFEVNNVYNTTSALTATTNSQGYLSTAFSAVNTGEGGAAYLQTNSSFVPANALEVNVQGEGAAGVFTVSGASGNLRGAIEVTSNGDGSAGLFRQNSGGTAASAAIDVTTTGLFTPAALFTVNNVDSERGAIEVMTNGGSSGWAGLFTSTGAAGGVRIVTSGGPGLQVTGGTKNAVVRTSSGARALYTEESTEVWFTDYAFARLTNGRAHVAIDSTFAETVNLTEPYHVFVQTYGDAELVVRNRTAEGFDVILREGEERDAEFSYRLVAKRLGFESERLKRAPWADTATAKITVHPRSGTALAARSH